MIISEEILKESSTYRYWFEIGWAIGRLQARREDLSKLLTWRFGPQSAATQRKVESGPIEKLGRGVDRALGAASLKDALK